MEIVDCDTYTLPWEPNKAYEKEITMNIAGWCIGGFGLPAQKGTGPAGTLRFENVGSQVEVTAINVAFNYKCGGKYVNVPLYYSGKWLLRGTTGMGVQGLSVE